LDGPIKSSTDVENMSEAMPPCEAQLCDDPASGETNCDPANAPPARPADATIAETFFATFVDFGVGLPFSAGEASGDSVERLVVCSSAMLILHHTNILSLICMARIFNLP
jgi:hypothetical protein